MIGDKQMTGNLPSNAGIAEAIGICTSVVGHRHALTPAKLRMLAESGVEWIEIAALQSQHLNIFDAGRVEELAAALARLQLRVWSLHAPFCGLAMDDADTRADGLRKLLQAARLAERFGALGVVVHPGRDMPSVDRAREVAWTREGIARALDGMPDGVSLALETMGIGSIGGPAHEMLAILEGLDRARVGICLDTGHVNTGGDVLEYIGAVAGHILTVHLHDNYGDRDAHDLPGNGNLDWPALLGALRRAGYGGPLIGECGLERLSSCETATEFIRRMRAYLTTLDMGT
jgi:sugar phosphate isomerase/epimerase